MIEQANSSIEFNHMDSIIFYFIRVNINKWNKFYMKKDQAL
jgi:sugar phosphate permease